jgi:hypothetical protein
MNRMKGEKNMTETWTIDFYQLLKKGGLMAEKKLNDLIKDTLNKEKIILHANKNSKVLAEKITKARHHTENLSILLNFPTKNDLAHTTNLLIQTEDKVDQLQASLYELEKLTEEIKQDLTFNQEEHSHHVQQIQKDLQSLKRALKGECNRVKP